MDKSWEILERVLQASIREQRTARRWKNFFQLSTLGLVVAAYVAGGPSLTEMWGEKSKGITAKVSVSGTIAEGERAGASVISRGLEAAFKDPRTKAVILDINSPGGSPVQAGRVYDEIKRERSLHPKIKVYAVIGDLGASGAYYIASAADEIYADKASLVGSIGVTAASFGYVDLMKKLGVERRAYTSGEHKAFLDQFQPENPAETAFWQGVLQQTHKQFIAAVVAGRGDRLKVKDNPDLFSGLVWSGQQAVGLGLVDKLGDANFVARDVVGAEKIVDFTPRGSALDRFANRVGASLAGEVAMTLGLQGLELR